MTEPAAVAPEAEARVHAVAIGAPARAEPLRRRTRRDARDDPALRGAGLRVPHRNVPGVRRVLLRASRVHVDDVEQPASVAVLTVWNAVRDRSPDLGRLHARGVAAGDEARSHLRAPRPRRTRWRLLRAVTATSTIAVFADN